MVALHHGCCDGPDRARRDAGGRSPLATSSSVRSQIPFVVCTSPNLAGSAHTPRTRWVSHRCASSKTCPHPPVRRQQCARSTPTQRESQHDIVTSSMAGPVLGQFDRTPGGDVGGELAQCPGGQAYTQRSEDLPQRALDLWGGMSLLAARQCSQHRLGVAASLLCHLAGYARPPGAWCGASCRCPRGRTHCDLPSSNLCSRHCRSRTRRPFTTRRASTVTMGRSIARQRPLPLCQRSVAPGHAQGAHPGQRSVCAVDLRNGTVRNRCFGRPPAIGDRRSPRCRPTRGCGVDRLGSAMSISWWPRGHRRTVVVVIRR
jgi:hypothetical protein